MKIKPTPFLIASVLLFLYGLYLLLLAVPDEGGWKALAGRIITSAAIGLFILYILFRALFKSKVWTQAGIEMLLLCIALFFLL